MRLLVLLVLVAGALAITREQCDEVTNPDEMQYICNIGDSTVTFYAKQNEHVRIFCEGTNITCPEIPRFDFASGLSLRSLSISSCSPRILRCVNEVISASSLEIVTLENLSEPLEKEDVEKLGDVRVLIMEQAGAQTSLPISVLNGLPTLKQFRVKGGNFKLSPNMFKQRLEGQHQLSYLELAQDNIVQLSEGAFQGLGKLNDLNIFSNNIENVTVGAFKGLDSLQKLTLNTNQIKYIEAGSFSDIPQLVSLRMTSNTLETLPNGLFQGLDHLEDITIQYNSAPLTLDTEAFSQLPSLKNIVLKHSGVPSLPTSLFNGSTSLISLDLMNNKIEDLPARLFLTQVSLKRLDLRNNKIAALPKGIFAGLKSMEYLNLDNNFIEALPSHLFSGPKNLKEVYINNNRISTIEPTSFQGASNLLTLSLSSNRLTLEPQTSYQDFIVTSPFQSATNLRQLNLSNNNISNIFYDWRAVMISLEYLDLSLNMFQGYQYSEYETFLSDKITVDLRHNNISHVIIYPSSPPQPLTDDTTPPNYSNTTILLDYNPIICDCVSYHLRLRADGIRYARNEPKFELGNTKCASPIELEGELIKNVPPKDFLCKLDEEIPEGCSSCIARVATNELLVDCPKMPAVLPDTNSYNITGYYLYKEPTITLKLTHAPATIYGLNIHTLNISNANINELEFKPTESLKILDISYNNLKSIPTEFMEGNLTLYLKNNSLECDCWSTDSVAAIKNYRYIVDLAQVTCAGGGFIDLIDPNTLCNTLTATITGIGTFIGCAICILIIITFIYRYYNEILIYLTTRGLCKCCVSEEMLDKDKEYDLFVSFAHQDSDMVQDTLLPILEIEFKQKVCVHYRDWVVGDMIPDQIVRSVESSRRTVIVLSKNFLESMWANLEFKAAHNLALQEGKARVILILLKEDLAKSENLSNELKAYISTNTYLLYNDPKFKEKLYKVLPKIVRKFTWLEYFKQRRNNDSNNGNTEKVMSNGLDVHLNSDGQLVNVGKEKNCYLNHDCVINAI